MTRGLAALASTVALGSLGEADNDELWLALAALGGRLPTLEEVRALRRDVDLGEGVVPSTLFGRPRVVSGCFVVETQEARVDLPGVPTLRWSRGDRRLTHNGRPVVPWGAQLILNGIERSARRSALLAAIASHSRSTTIAIGHGTVPFLIGASPSVDTAGYASYLSALQRFTAIAAASAEAVEDMMGWRDSLGAVGIAGPEIFLAKPPLGDAPTSEYLVQLLAFGSASQ